MSSSVERQYQDPKGLYQLPNDAPELERLDAQSLSIVALMNNKPFHAPLQDPKKILDVGCGTGSMTSLLASLYPEAQVIGIDIAAVQEGRHEQQPNLQYVQGDIRELAKSSTDPNFQPESFDYIFNRLIILGMDDWVGYVESMTSLLRPNGWLETQEPSIQLISAKGDRISDKTWSFYPAIFNDAKALGLDIEVGPRLAGYFRQNAKLANVHEKQYDFGPVAEASRPAIGALEGQTLGLFLVVMWKMCGGRSEEERSKMEQDIRSIWEKGFDKDDHFTMYAVTGQKKAT